MSGSVRGVEATPVLVFFIHNYCCKVKVPAFRPGLFLAMQRLGGATLLAFFLFFLTLTTLLGLRLTRLAALLSLATVLSLPSVLTLSGLTFFFCIVCHEMLL